MERYFNSLLVCSWTIFSNCIFNQYIFRQNKNICFGDFCIGMTCHVSYYLIMIFVLWLLVRFIKNDLVKWLVALFDVYILYWGCVHFVHIDCVVSIMEKFPTYFSMTVTGYLCFKRMWFENLEELMQRKRLFVQL